VLASDGRYGLFVLRPTGIVTADEGGPLPASGFSLTTARPNPTTGLAQLELRIAESQHVRVEAFDVLGRSAAIVFDGAIAAGAAQTLVFDAAGLAVGPYLLRVAGETFSTTARVSVAR
jgi:hypothetical protein